MLLGAATAMAVAGLVLRFRILFGDRGPLAIDVTGTVVGIAMMTLALGVRLPQQFAVWVCAVAWRRFVSRGRPSQMSAVLLGPDGADRPLYWVVLSVTALAAGVTIALLPVGLRLAGYAYDGMLARFIWSIGPLAVLQAGLVFLTGLVPLTILGLSISCAHHLSCPYGRWETRATAWALVGAAAGLLISASLGSRFAGGDLAIFVAALPALLIALVSAASSASRDDGVGQNAEVDTPPLPISSDRWPTLLRASNVAVGAGGVCAVALGVDYLGEVFGLSTTGLPAAVLAMGLGVLVGCRKRGTRPRSIGGFGVACATAGVVVAAAAMGLTYLSSSAPGGATLLVCAGVFAIGLATAYGRQTLLCRVANRSFAGAKVLARMLVWGALAAWIAVPLAGPVIDWPTALMVLALFQLALGGALIIHEPGYASRTRRVRLCAIFGCIGTMIVLLVSSPNLWRHAPVSDRMQSTGVSSGERRIGEPAHIPARTPSDSVAKRRLSPDSTLTHPSRTP